MDFSKYTKEAFEKKRLKNKGVQSTRHQQDALETAKMLGDMKSVGIYMRLFKTFRFKRDRLLACRDWVMENCKENKGRIFVRTFYKKFR